MINKESELWEKKLNDIFKKKEITDTDTFLNLVSMIVYNNINNEDISRLHSAVDLDNFLKVITLFENRTVTFPSKKEIKSSIELALYYYYKNVLGITDYSKLKSMGLSDPQELSPISIGKRIAKLNKEIVEKLEHIEDLIWAI